MITHEADTLTAVLPRLRTRHARPAPLDALERAARPLACAVVARDRTTGLHTRRVTAYALMLARQLGLSGREQALLRIGTPLHDVGKIGVPDAILRKPGPLTPDEFERMKTHTLIGAALVRTVPELAPVLPIVRHHHERWDGAGYPDRLAGEAIPLLARVVTVADVFDALTSPRPYRRSLAPSAAFAHIAEQSGALFDPQLVPSFLALRPQLEKSLGT